MKNVDTITGHESATKYNSLIINAACVVICALLIAYNKEAMSSAKIAFDIWVTAVMPALFPFFVCTSIMQKNGIFETNKANPFVSIIAAFFASAISGAPSGARLISQLNVRLELDQNIASSLSAMCNMVSPIFIVGTVSVAMLGSIRYAIPIMIGHYLSSAIMLLLYLLINRKKINKAATITKMLKIKPDNSKILIDSILEGGTSVLKVCGTIIFFMVFTEVVNQAGLFDFILKPFTLIGLRVDVLKSIFVGMLEMTNGSYSLSQLNGVSLPLLVALISFALTFGGVCIMTQSQSFSNLNQRKYLSTKFLCSCLAFVITYFASIVFLSDSIATSGILHEGLTKQDLFTSNLFSVACIVFASLLGIATIYLTCIVKSKKRMEQK